MPAFHYKALDSSGRYVNGTLEARNLAHARQKLRTEKLTPVELYGDEAEEDGISSPHKPRVVPLLDRSEVKFKRTETDKQALLFLTKLYQLIDSGMPLGDAVRSLSQRIFEPRMRTLTHFIWKDLAEGNTLADALAGFPEVFDATTVSMIEAGEATGSLSSILHNLIELIEERIEMRKKIISGFAYPAFISLVAVAVVAFFLFFLLPRIEGIMGSLGAEMTWSARTVIWLAESAFFYGPFVLVVAILALIGLAQWRKTPEGRLKMDRFLLKVPVVRKILLDAEVCRISNLSSILLGSGVNATEALRLIEKAIQNQHLQSRFRSSRTLINDGASFSNAFMRYGILEDMDVDVLSIGENTGNLVSSFNSIYKRHNTEMADQMRLLTVVVSTGALLIAFSLVILLALGIVTSIMQLSQSILG